MEVQEVVLVSPPTDGITAVKFAPDSNLLLASSWDASVRLFDTDANILKAIQPGKAALLDVSFYQDSNHAISGGLDRSLRLFDFTTSSETILGTHEAPIKHVVFHKETGLIFSGSWDKTVCAWDPRASNAQIGRLPLPEKVFAMDVSSTRLVVGTNARRVLIFDIRKAVPTEPEQHRESSLKYQTRCIKCNPDNQGYALSSVEGRVAIEYFDLSPEVQKQKYAFKCHRATVNGTDVVYPVNALAYHPGYGTFASGGCDGVVNIWDGSNKKRIVKLKQCNTSISSLAFNSSGNKIAIAASYTFEEGEKEHPADQIIVRDILDSDVRPKMKEVV